MLSFVVVCGHGRSNRFWCQCYPLQLFVDTEDQTSFGVNVILCCCLWTRKIKPVLVSMLFNLQSPLQFFVDTGDQTGFGVNVILQLFVDTGDQTGFGVNVILCSCLWTRKIKPVLVSMLSFVVVCGHGRSNRFWCQCYPLQLFVDTEDQTSFGVNVILCSCLQTREIKPVLVSMLSFVVVCRHVRSNRFWCQCYLIFSLLCSCLQTRRSNRSWCQCYPLQLFVDTEDQTSFGANVV